MNREEAVVLAPLAIRPMNAREFACIRELAQETCGIDFAESKKDMIASRLDRAMRRLNLPSYEAYYAYLQSDRSGQAIREFIDAVATNYTNFLREPDHFAFLRERFSRVSFRGRPIRLWSAACSTGEEPYSIAMTMLDLRRQDLVPGFQVLASDISTRALAIADAGVYPRDRLRDVPLPWVSEFFDVGVGRWNGSVRVKKTVRDTIRFERFNLLDSAAEFGAFDVIFCRNVMLYFNRATQEKIVNRMAERLIPGGYLLTGHTESLLAVRHSLNYLQPAVYQRTA